MRSSVYIFSFCLFALVVGRRLPRAEPSLNFVGEGTNDLSISILQSEGENRTNLVFSPLGYSVILAILAEGSRGNTRNQLVHALKLPEDTYAVRNTYKLILTNMQEHGQINKAEFKNWFYVYKNYTAEKSYKSVLSEYYLTDVKEINNDPDYTGVDTSGENEKPTDATEIFETTTVLGIDEKTEKINDEENTVLDKVQEEVVGDILMRALKHDVQVEKEMLTALSANRLSSNVKDSESDEKPSSRMIIFNALYFRGNWSSKFILQEEKPFYTSESEKKPVKMLRSEDEFEYGQISELDATAIEIPYQGERYSLLIVVPNSKNGLAKLSSKLTGFSFRDIRKHLTKKHICICLPKFKFYSITRPKNALVECGISDIFDESADLSGITGSKGLYLDDLVQLVTIEVTENDSSYNFLTTSSVAETRTASDKYVVDRPFLFFLRDRIDNLFVVAGKVQDPTLEKDDE